MGRITDAVSEWPMAETLGWLSVGLGLTGLLTPRQTARVSGLTAPGVVRLIGARELVSGIGLLTQSNKSPWLWARVAGDAMDLAAIAMTHGGTRRGRSRAVGAAAVVAAITAADVWAAYSSGIGRLRQGRRAQSRPEAYFERTLIVNKPARECYDYWRDLGNVPKFTRRLKSVTPLDERRSKWVMSVPGGPDVSWVAEMIEDKPGERLRWRSEESSPLRHSGSVSFREVPGGRGTFVTVSMHYQTPADGLGNLVARVIGRDPFGEVRENLRRFKQLLETGEIATTTGQPSGSRSMLGSLLPEGRRSRQPSGRATDSNRRPKGGRRDDGTGSPTGRTPTQSQSEPSRGPEGEVSA
jgi:uncharacterized membrane protein